MAIPAQSPLSLLTISSYNGAATVNNGVAAQVATIALTAQAATLTNHALFTPAYTGFYRLTGWMKKTQAATSSSTLGTMTLSWTDVDTNSLTFTMGFVGSTGTIVQSNAANTAVTLPASANTLVPFTLYASSGNPITFTLTYASTGATPMQYELYLVLEAL